jgi:hypothetical protein
MRPSGGGTTSVVPSSQERPEGFQLFQNYPNPFNPTTIIRYQLQEANHVIPKVFDMLGREVATLVNDNMNAGSYETVFEPSKIASGMYIYRVQVGQFTDLKKLIYMK